MGLLQKACETYDAMAHRAGQIYEGEAEPLAPISHIMARAQIEITLDQDGRFVSARAVDKGEPKIIIPVTEESAGRTSAPCAHPLCDQLGYVAPHDAQKHTLYVDGLSNWADSEHSHPKLRPILDYVRSGTILSDLSGAGLIALSEEGRPKDEKLMVCWVVNGFGEEWNGPCWKDQKLMEAFVHYSAEKRAGSPPALCMISGTIEAPASQHPKGIVPTNGNAKLISANDSSGFTYRGRFEQGWQAATVSYAASQKAHSALRWLVANQSVPFGGRTFLCWNPQGIQVPKVTGPMSRKRGDAQRAANPTQYRQQLRESLFGWKEYLPQSAGVVIAAFDAATTGRLAVTYYNELLASDFLDRLHNWEASCCWENGPFGIQSPSLFQIVSWAFGTPRNGKSEIDDRILAQQMQQLLACRVDKASFPLDIERALAEKASHLLLYEGENRQKLLFTACAAIRKYHYDHLKEEWGMALDKNCSDRSYLFGRLLAIADAVENSTYTSEDRRETNALRMQKAFSLRPMATWRLLEEKLEPYYKQLNPGLRHYYRKLTQEITDKLSASDSNLNQKLDDVYLLGYYHQRAYRTGKADKPETKE
ncbi:MAG: type I-C CRISPR-associated protein Cas8c/Csd1 [Clostridiales bacterium]|nr:type I-C CRISPR-associated protein Cas8c/Csd1 [Clostridiales bacterium]